MRFDYPPPLDQLTRNPEYNHNNHETWPDYVRSYGLTADHVPELIRMASDLDTFWNLDDVDDPAVYAPLHAVRALGQLGDARAIAPLLSLAVYNEETFGGGDFLMEIIPRAVGMMGSAALEPLRIFLLDTHTPLWPKVYMTAALEVIAQVEPTAHEACVETTAGLLANYAATDPTLNASYVSALLNLKAVARADVIGAAFAAGCVDESVNGDWEDVLLELGLITKRVTPRPHYFWKSLQAAQEKTRLAQEQADLGKTRRSFRRRKKAKGKKGRR